jgi:hypothetical protein
MPFGIADYKKDFILLCLVSVIIQWTSNFILLTEDVYYEVLQNQISLEKIDELISGNQKWGWLIYTFIPIFLFLKISLVVGSLFIGTSIQRNTISMRPIFKIVILSEFIFLLLPIIKLVWFSVFNTDYNLNDLQLFSPLSIFSLTSQNLVESWLVYPLCLLNLFELAYWCILAWQLKDILNRDFVGSLGFVAKTYGVGLLLWVIFVMFLTVSLT